MKSEGDKEEMEIKDRRVRAFAKEIAKEYAALAIKQANEQADEIAKQADVVIRKAEQVEKDYALPLWPGRNGRQ